MTKHAQLRKATRWVGLALILFFSQWVSQADTITLTWEAPQNSTVASYKIYRTKNISDPFLPVATTITTYVKVFVPGSAEGHLYYVTAVGADGGESSPSNVIEIGKTLGVRVDPDVLTFRWNDSRYVLESAPTPEGPWTLYTPSSPAFADTTKPMDFFRLRNL